MASFNFSRGCVYRVDQQSSGGGAAMVKITPDIRSDNENSPVILSGVQLNDQDLVLPVVTLDNDRILYTFGEDFGSFNIIGLALLGTAGGNGDALSHVNEWFSTNRVSKIKKPITVTLGGGGAYKVFVTGLTVAEADTTYHIQPFVINGRIAKAP